jgi:hypothetical protein
MANHRRSSIAGAFAWRLIEMLESPAHRTLSLSARKILDRLEIELYRHGGKPEQNGLLPCTFDHFVEFGVHRHAIGPAIREVVALGFVEITRKGSAGNAGYRQPTLYRLRYRHAGSDKRVTDDWRHTETIEEAEAVAERARKAGETERRPDGRPKNKSPVSETITTSPVSETVTTSISRGGTLQKIDGCSTPDDGVADGSRARFRCRRAGALSFERWGQAKPDPAPAKRPRRAGVLSKARWRAPPDTGSNSQPPIPPEALPSDAAPISNAHRADPPRLMVDVSTPPAPTAALVH